MDSGNGLRKGKHTRTYTGIKFWPLDPRTDEVCLEDIAHSLSRIVRFGGHINEPYTVAQHSILVSRNCEPENALWGLLHDATEAYVGDVISPIKAMIPQVKEIEMIIMPKICEKFGLSATAEPYDVWVADKRMVITEHKLLRGGDLLGYVENLKPYSWSRIEVMGHDEAKAAFLHRFNEITGRTESFGRHEDFEGGRCLR